MVDYSKGRKPLDRFIRPSTGGVKIPKRAEREQRTRLDDKRSVYIDELTWTRLKLIAARKGVRANVIVEALIKNYIDGPDAL